jgi:UDP-N-acetylmuramoyl-L-alanyl-D-glutamate--2,6-diaminopimelate ligase
MCAQTEGEAPLHLAQLTGPDAIIETAAPGPAITGLTADSRAVKPGWLFAALAGSRTDGARFIVDAVANGAAAVLLGSGAPADVPAGIAIVRAAEPRRALARMAARFHGRQPETIVAVTGTNGKTSVAEFTRQIFAMCGKQAASLGTIGIVKPSGADYGGLTTPDPVALAATLAGLADEGITHLALEASSHGLDQFRLDGVRLAAGAFNNLGRDHLDYHPTMEAYLAAKLRLWELLEPGQTAVVNADGEASDKAIAAAVARGLEVMTTGRAGRNVRLDKAKRQGFAQRLQVSRDGRCWHVDLPLIGEYQAGNALVAAGLALAIGCDEETVMAALGGLKGVKGRLEVVAEARGGIAVVDYAHKPEALAAALAALRPFAAGKLICIVGCGGDRDRGKRPLMGRIAAERADIAIITDDNPRSEVPAAIRAEVLAGAPTAREIGDRAEAIQAGVALLGPGDVLLVAGKGHETGQIIGDKVLPFSDQEEVLKAVAEIGA